MPDLRNESTNRGRDIALVTLILLGVVSIFALSRRIDAQRPPPDPTIEEEKLYLTGNTAKRMSLGFNG